MAITALSDISRAGTSAFTTGGSSAGAAIAYSVLDISNSGNSASLTATTGSFNVAANTLLVAMYANSNSTVTNTITSTGSGVTWTKFADVGASGDDGVRGYWAVVPTAQALTVSFTNSGDTVAYLRLFVVTGALNSAPIPSLSVFTGVTNTSPLAVNVTPSTSSSLLFGILSDFNASGSYVAGSGTTISFTQTITGRQTVAMIQPTTNPVTSTGIVPITVTSSGAHTSYLIFEIASAGGGGSSSSGSTVAAGLANLNFGAIPVRAKQFTITDTSATTASKIIMTASPNPTNALGDDELEMDGFDCAAYCAVNGTITAYIVANPGPVMGARNFNYLLV